MNSSLPSRKGNYRDAGRLAEAIPLLEEAQRAAEKYGAADFAGILATCIIADMAANRGDYQRAEEILTERLTSLRQSKDDQRFAILQIELGLANIAQARGDNEAAAIKHGTLLERAQKELGDGHWLTLTAMNNRGFALARGRKFAEAEKTLQETIERQVRFLGEGHMNLLQTRTNLGELYQLRGDHARAEELLRKCLAEREKKEPNSFREASTQSMLGRVLAEQKKFAEAEALLLAGYKGLKDNPNTTPGWGKYYLPDTLEWLVQLYEMTDKEDEAAKRQAERAKYPPAAPAANEKK